MDDPLIIAEMAAWESMQRKNRVGVAVVNKIKREFNGQEFGREYTGTF